MDYFFAVGISQSIGQLRQQYQRFLRTEPLPGFPVVLTLELQAGALSFFQCARFQIFQNQVVVVVLNAGAVYRNDAGMNELGRVFGFRQKTVAEGDFNGSSKCLGNTIITYIKMLHN